MTFRVYAPTIGLPPQTLSTARHGMTTDAGRRPSATMARRCQTRRMEPAAFLDTVPSNGELLAIAAQANPEARVPTCPDWDLTGLLAHVGTVHHWVNHIVASRATGPSNPDDDGPPSMDPDAVLAWYRQGLTDVVETLRGTDPDSDVWNWFDRGPAPARFWFRRMALETSVHRWDGENAVGEAHPLDVDLAIA
ncbi:MAG: hypothetical protein QOK39_1838, partial [Acidimicrobiaceae bacterium]|nr:hypothetical protein [Acidimicrobiaceae bacterium]